MGKPMAVRVDLRIPAAYLTYGELTSVKTREVDDGGAMAYDFDDAGTIVGLEVLWIDVPLQVEAAREFAAKQDLAFPRDLRRNIVAA